MLHPDAPILAPSFHGFINSTHDALLLFEACRSNRIPKITRRLQEKERASLIVSGAVFVFDEKESGIKRWTDNLLWSPSRILGNFLIYRELDKKEPQAPGSSSSALPLTAQQIVADDMPSAESSRERHLLGSLTSSYRFKNNGLVKKTISVAGLHMIAYYKVVDVMEGRLRCPSDIAELMAYEISPQLLLNQTFRIQPKIEYGPDGVGRYAGDADDNQAGGSSSLSSSTRSDSIPVDPLSNKTANSTSPNKGPSRQNSLQLQVLSQTQPGSLLLPEPSPSLPDSQATRPPSQPLPLPSPQQHQLSQMLPHQRPPSQPQLAPSPSPRTHGYNGHALPAGYAPALHPNLTASPEQWQPLDLPQLQATHASPSMSRPSNRRAASNERGRYDPYARQPDSHPQAHVHYMQMTPYQTGQATSNWPRTPDQSSPYGGVHSALPSPTESHFSFASDMGARAQGPPMQFQPTQVRSYAAYVDPMEQPAIPSIGSRRRPSTRVPYATLPSFARPPALQNYAPQPAGTETASVRSTVDVRPSTSSSIHHEEDRYSVHSVSSDGSQYIHQQQRSGQLPSNQDRRYSSPYGSAQTQSFAGPMPAAGQHVMYTTYGSAVVRPTLAESTYQQHPNYAGPVPFDGYRPITVAPLPNEAPLPSPGLPQPSPGLPHPSPGLQHGMDAHHWPHHP